MCQEKAPNALIFFFFFDWEVLTHTITSLLFLSNDTSFWTQAHYTLLTTCPSTRVFSKAVTLFSFQPFAWFAHFRSTVQWTNSTAH